MSSNPKHYTSETPCAKCGGRERYKSTKNCCPCLKASVTARRKRIADIVATASPADPSTDDLIGDISCR